jgi:hypothetical protein
VAAEIRRIRYPGHRELRLVVEFGRLRCGGGRRFYWRQRQIDVLCFVRLEKNGGDVRSVSTHLSSHGVNARTQSGKTETALKVGIRVRNRPSVFRMQADRRPGSRFSL